MRQQRTGRVRLDGRCMREVYSCDLAKPLRAINYSPFSPTLSINQVDRRMRIILPYSTDEDAKSNNYLLPAVLQQHHRRQPSHCCGGVRLYVSTTLRLLLWLLLRDRRHIPCMLSSGTPYHFALPANPQRDA